MKQIRDELENVHVSDVACYYSIEQKDPNHSDLVRQISKAKLMSGQELIPSMEANCF